MATTSTIEWTSKTWNIVVGCQKVSSGCARCYAEKMGARLADLRAVPCAVRFLSLEPLLEPLSRLDLNGITWVIVGGESGPGARPMRAEWVRDIRDQCSGVFVWLRQYEPLSATEFRSSLAIDKTRSDPC